MADTYKHQRLFDYNKYWESYRNRNKKVEWWCTLDCFEYVAHPPEQKDINEPDIPYKWHLTKRSWCRKDQWRKHRLRWKNALRTQNWDRMKKLSIKPTSIWWIID